MAWPQMKSSEAISAPAPKKITLKRLVISSVLSLT